MAANDDNYFVFEDIMHQVLLCLLHDSSLTKQLERVGLNPLDADLYGMSL